MTERSESGVSRRRVLGGVAAAGLGTVAAVDATRAQSATGTTVYTVGGVELQAVEAATGEKQWAVEVGLVAPSPVVQNGTVYVAGADGVFAVDAVSGEQEWRFEPTDRVDSSPTVVDGTVYHDTARESRPSGRA